jgi:hypothetical protein
MHSHTTALAADGRALTLHTVPMRVRRDLTAYWSIGITRTDYAVAAGTVLSAHVRDGEVINVVVGGHWCAINTTYLEQLAVPSNQEDLRERIERVAPAVLPVWEWEAHRVGVGMSTGNCLVCGASPSCVVPPLDRGDTRDADPAEARTTPPPDLLFP